MSEIFIKAGSVTNAQRIESLLKKNGYRAAIRRSSKVKRGEGCGYSVIAKGDIGEIAELIKNSRIKYTEFKVL